MKLDTLLRDDVTRYFLDTEFYEDGEKIDLISIAVIRNDGREFYAVNQDAQLHRVSPWVREHVLPHLPPYGDPAWKTRAEIAVRLKDFVLSLNNPRAGDWKREFWAYYGSYDWIAICQLFGTMMDLPNQFPKFCWDLKQLSVMVGSPKHPKQEAGEHNALADARWNRDLFEFLTKKAGAR